MDVCELLWGSNLFLDIQDHPGLVKDLLELITLTYINFMKEWETIVPFPEGYAVHWSMMHKGKIFLRNDSAMNFSPDMYKEFIMPYDQKLFDAFGGGGMHFCGRGSHFIQNMSEMRGLYTINMSQPHLNDMETIYQNTIDKGIKLTGFSKEYADKALASGRKLYGNVQCY